ncbi:MAG: hypothetical protein QM777_25520 [Pseudorhodoferax sp.]
MALELVRDIETTPGGARLVYHTLALRPGPSDIGQEELRAGTAAELGTLASLLRDLFLDHYRDIEFGPVIAGAIFELRLERPPEAVFVRDGYLNVHLPAGAGHLHLGIALSSANASLDTSGAIERSRRCSHAALFEGHAPSELGPRTWGLRLWNGAGQQMITFFFDSSTGARRFAELRDRYASPGATTMWPSAST